MNCGFKQNPDFNVKGAQKQRFSLHESNGGSVVAIAGADYAVIAADTCLISDNSVLKRNQDRLCKLSSKAVLGSMCCWSDTLELVALIRSRMQSYECEHFKTMSIDAIAHMLSKLKYEERSFACVLNVLAGIDNRGKGVVYLYDDIGHFDRAPYGSGGSEKELLQLFLDDHIVPELPMMRAVSIATEAFISASADNIHTGDFVKINIITKAGVEVKEVPLSRD